MFRSWAKRAPMRGYWSSGPDVSSKNTEVFVSTIDAKDSWGEIIVVTYKGDKWFYDRCKRTPRRHNKPDIVSDVAQQGPGFVSVRMSRTWRFVFCVAISSCQAGSSLLSVLRRAYVKSVELAGPAMLL